MSSSRPPNAGAYVEHDRQTGRLTTRHRSPGRPVAVGVAAVGLGLAGVVTASPQADAAGSCSAGPTVTQPTGEQVPSRYCPTWTGTPVWYYPNVAFGGPAPGADGQSGYLNAGTNWVVCQFTGNDNPTFGSSDHNHYWLLTQGDRSDDGGDAWGYIPATAVNYGGNEEPIPGVPLCHGGWY